MGVQNWWFYFFGSSQEYGRLGDPLHPHLSMLRKPPLQLRRVPALRRSGSLQTCASTVQKQIVVCPEGPSVCTCVSMYIYIYTYTNTHTQIYIYTYMYMYNYIIVYTYICMLYIYVPYAYTYMYVYVFVHVHIRVSIGLCSQSPQIHLRGSGYLSVKE